MNLTTDRLILRYFQQDDFKELHALLSDPEVMRFSLNGPYNKEKSAEFLEKSLEQARKQEPSLYAVFDKVSGAFIGSCGLYLQRINGKERWELGYRLLPKYWGQGLASEAAQAVKNYAFSSLGLTGLISIIEPENIGSIKVAKRNGFTLESSMLYNKKISVKIYALSA